MKKNKYPLLITLAILAIIGGLFVSQNNKTITKLNPQLTTSQASGGDIVINARGTNGKEKIALYINNTPVNFWNLTNSFKDYTYTPNGEITVSELSIHFLNDTWEPEKNINYDVQIPYIEVNGEKFESQHEDVTSTGSWDQENWCAKGNKQTQWLNCNGSFTYNIPVGTVVGLPNTQDPLTLIGTPEIIEQAETEVRIRFTMSEKAKARIEYGETTSYGKTTNGEQSFTFDTHAQWIRDLKKATTYNYRILGEDEQGNTHTSQNYTFTTAGTSTPDPVCGNNKVESGEQCDDGNTSSGDGCSSSCRNETPTTGDSVTFNQIKANGLANGCYPDDDHYVAEFLYQNPDACFWKLDKSNKTVSKVDTPTPPSNAIELPRPSGGDDTSALERVINANSGKAVVGRGTYKVNGLDINVPIDIFNMPMEPSGTAGIMVKINAPDVRIFSSPIDAKNSRTTYMGFQVTNGSHRFTLVDSGFSNIYHTNNNSAAGVQIRGVDDFHIACNTFENIVNDTNENVTARANAIWMYGEKFGARLGQTTSGGYIVNNYAKEHQSNGKLNDAEFFTEQSYRQTSVNNPVKIFANRAVNAGKRFTKHQEDNAVVLSNDHEWTEKQGPLGSRTLLANVEVHFSDNIIARNNRVKIGADSRFDWVFHTQVNYGTDIQDNIHYDCNDIEITDKLDPNSNNIPILFMARMTTKPRNSTGFEATNSSANNNRVHGNGSVRYFYNFDHGYDDRGGKFEHEGNVFEIDYLNSKYR